MNTHEYHEYHEYIDGVRGGVRIESRMESDGVPGRWLIVCPIDMVARTAVGTGDRGCFKRADVGREWPSKAAIAVFNLKTSGDRTLG